MLFTDSHCHLDFDEIYSHLNATLSTCAKLNIHQIIIPSIAPSNWQKVLTLAKKQANKHCKLYPCLGIHPWFLDDLNQQDLDNLAALAEQSHQQLIAIGETGIDITIAEQHATPEKHLAKQIAFFEYQLHLANQLALPVIIHHRKSHQHIVPILKKIPVRKTGVVHAFSGSFQQAKAYLDLGFKLGIGGTITYPRAEKTMKTVSKLPIDAMVLETDAPAMPLYGFQGESNCPSKVLKVFEQLLTLRNESKEALAEQLEKNVSAIFTL